MRGVDVMRAEPVHALAPYECTIAGLRLLSEQNRREHYHARNDRRERQQLLTHAALRSQIGLRPPVFASYAVTITRLGPHVMDTDGNVASAKHVRDAIAKWLGIDDGDVARLRFEVRYERASKPSVRITIADLALHEHRCAMCGHAMAGGAR